MDEALYASCAREMFQRGDWVVPWFNGHMFPEKPVLMFWTMMAGFESFGVNELGARFFSAVLGVATALSAFPLGPNRGQRPSRTLDGVDYGVDAYFHGVGPGGDRRFGLDLRHHGGVPAAGHGPPRPSRQGIVAAAGPDVCLPGFGGAGQGAGGNGVAAGGDGLLPVVDRRLAEGDSFGMVDAALHGVAHHGGRGTAVARGGGHADRRKLAAPVFSGVQSPSLPAAYP